MEGFEPIGKYMPEQNKADVLRMNDDKLINECKSQMKLFRL
jgi:hypothetical protein